MQLERLYEEFLEKGKEEFAEKYILLNDEVYKVNFEQNRPNTCTLSTVENCSHAIKRKKREIKLTRKLKGVPIFYHSEIDFSVQIDQKNNQQKQVFKFYIQDQEIYEIKEAFDIVEKTGEDYFKPLNRQPDHLLFVRTNDWNTVRVYDCSNPDLPRPVKLSIDRTEQKKRYNLYEAIAPKPDLLGRHRQTVLAQTSCEYRIIAKLFRDSFNQNGAQYNAGIYFSRAQMNLKAEID